MSLLVRFLVINFHTESLSEADSLSLKIDVAISEGLIPAHLSFALWDIFIYCDMTYNARA